MLTAFIWGMAFSAQRNGMEYMPPALFNATRSFLGALSLLPLMLIIRCEKTNKPEHYKKNLWFGGLVCGSVLGCGSLLQQLGLKYVPAGKGGFLTALYIVMVPLAGILFRRRTGIIQWAAVAAAITGSLMLCRPGAEFKFGIGETALLLGALMFAIHILVIDHFAPITENARLSALQFTVAGVLSLIISVITGEEAQADNFRAAALPLLYCGICSSGIAFTLQIIGQRTVHPVTASLIMSLESVFAAIGGALLLEETLTTGEKWGCSVIFLASVLAQLPALRTGGAQGKNQNSGL